MPTLHETVSSVSLDASVGADLQAAFTGLGDRTLARPAQVPQIVALAETLALPQGAALYGDVLARLGGLAGGGSVSRDGIWGGVSGGLASLESTLDSGVGAPLAETFARVRAVADAVPEDASGLLAALEEPLRAVVGVLTESPELAHVAEFVGKVDELRSTLEGSPAALAAVLQEQLEAALAEATALISPVVRQLDDLLAAAEGRLRLADLAARQAALVADLVPATGPSLPDVVAGLDFGAEDAVAELDARLRGVAVGMVALAGDLQARLASGADVLDAFNGEAWARRLGAAAERTAALEVNEVGNVFARWRAAVTEARDLVAGLSAEAVLDPLRDLTAEVRPLAEGLALDALEQTLSAPVEAARGAVEGVQALQLDVLAGASDVARSIEEALAAVDLDVVTAAVGDAMAAVDDAIAEIEGLVDGAASELQAGLAGLEGELESLHTALTDPAGSFRAPIDGFLAAIRDAIPDDIPALLADAGETVGEAVASLDRVAFEPVFDGVVEELHRMRDELRAIEPSALNALLEAALVAALAIFEAFDFESEVEDALVRAYDEAVADIAEPAIEALQEQVDLVLAFVRDNDPAALLGRLGLDDAYQSAVAGIADLRPSELLADVLGEVRGAAARLDGFTPSTVLEPLAAPLARLRDLVGAISPEPVFAELDAAVARLEALVGALDLGPAVGALAAAVARLRERLDSALRTEGLLAALRPVHEAVMAAVDTLDPAQLLQPVVEIREVLEDAVDAVDATAATAALEAVAARVDALRLPDLRGRLAAAARDLADGVDDLDLPARMQEIREAQRDIAAALEARGEQPDAASEQRRQGLLYVVRAFDPLIVFADALPAYRRANAALAALAAALDSALAAGGPLEQPLAAAGAKLRQLALGVESGSADVKQALRNAIEQGFAQLGVGELTGLYQEVRETFESYGPDTLEAQLDEVLAPIRDLIENLPDPAAALAGVVAAFDELKALVDPGLREFLTALRAEIEPVFEALGEKLDAVDLSAATAALDAQYADIRALKERLLAKLDELTAALDAPYEAVVELVDALNPGTVLVEPLQATYSEILAKIEGVSVRAVFEPLLEALARLRDRLVEQIERTAQAFREFLSASPVSVGASVGV